MPVTAEPQEPQPACGHQKGEDGRTLRPLRGFRLHSGGFTNTPRLSDLNTPTVGPPPCPVPLPFLPRRPPQRLPVSAVSTEQPDAATSALCTVPVGDPGSGRAPNRCPSTAGPPWGSSTRHPRLSRQPPAVPLPTAPEQGRARTGLGVLACPSCLGHHPSRDPTPTDIASRCFGAAQASRGCSGGRNSHGTRFISVSQACEERGWAVVTPLTTRRGSLSSELRRGTSPGRWREEVARSLGIETLSTPRLPLPGHPDPDTRPRLSPRVARPELAE